MGDRQERTSAPVAERTYEPAKLVGVRTALKHYFGQLDERYHRDRSKLATGLELLDERGGPLTCGDLVAIAGPSCSGKTSAGLAVARHVARSASPLLFVARGLGEMNVCGHLLSDEAALEPWALATGMLKRDDMMRVSAAAGVLAGGSIKFCTMDMTSIDGLSALVHRWRRSTFTDNLGDTPGLIVVDDLHALAQRVGSDATPADLGSLLTQLKSMARAVWSAVIVLCRTRGDAGDLDILATLERQSKAVLWLGE